MPFVVLVVFFWGAPIDLSCDRFAERATFLVVTGVLLGTLWWLSARSRLMLAAIGLTAALAVAAVADREVAELLFGAAVAGFYAIFLAAAVVLFRVAWRGGSLQPLVFLAGWGATVVAMPGFFVVFGVCGGDGL